MDYRRKEGGRGVCIIVPAKVGKVCLSVARRGGKAGARLSWSVGLTLSFGPLGPISDLGNSFRGPWFQSSYSTSIVHS